MLKLNNKIFLTSLLFAFCSLLKSQTNLVPNPSFEQISDCPDNLSELYRATGWINFQGSPDLLSECSAISTGISVPHSDEGFQYPASGIAFASMAMYSKSGQAAGVIIREWIGTQLITPLAKNTKYFISMKTSPGFVAQDFNAFTNNMSLLFTNYKLDSMTAQVLNKSHLRCTNVITDTTNWTMIKGSFVADSNYTNLVIGNLYSDGNTIIDTTIAHQNNYSIEYAYSFVDDICVSTDSVYAYNYIWTGIDKYNNNKHPSDLYPNPSHNGIFNTDTAFINEHIEVFDVLGNSLRKLSVTGNTIDLNYLDNGIYIIQFNKQYQSTQKLIINKQ